jgi:hypothetical protein
MTEVVEQLAHESGVTKEKVLEKIDKLHEVSGWPAASERAVGRLSGARRVAGEPHAGPSRLPPRHRAPGDLRDAGGSIPRPACVIVGLMMRTPARPAPSSRLPSTSRPRESWPSPTSWYSIVPSQSLLFPRWMLRFWRCDACALAGSSRRHREGAGASGQPHPKGCGGGVCGAEGHGGVPRGHHDRDPPGRPPGRRHRQGRRQIVIENGCIHRARS